MTEASHAVPQPHEVALIGQQAELHDGVDPGVLGPQPDFAAGEDAHDRSDQPAARSGQGCSSGNSWNGLPWRAGVSAPV